MQTYPGTVNRFVIKQGASLAIGTIIDAYLSQEEVRKLYDNWQRSWPEPLGFKGGEQAITCEQILDLLASDKKDADLFIKTYGKRLAEKLQTVARSNAGR